MKPISPVTPPPQNNQACADQYWFALIDEKAAASFLGLSIRTIQAMRQKGDGPTYIALSIRCVRYRRIDLRRWCNKHERRSTSDADGSIHLSNDEHTALTDANA